MVSGELVQRSVMFMSFMTALLLLAARWSLDSPQYGEDRAKQVANLAQNMVLPNPEVEDRASSSASESGGKLRAGFVAVRSSILVDLSDRTASVYRAGELVARYPIAVGQDGWETPAGTFEVVQMMKQPIWRHPITKEIVPPGKKNPLGSRWIGFWVDGEHQIGFHGTNEPNLIGAAVSHGCIRMHNADIEKMYDLVEVGSPVWVQS